MYACVWLAAVTNSIAGWSCCTLHTCAMDLRHCSGQYFSSRDCHISSIRSVCVCARACVCVWNVCLSVKCVCVWLAAMTNSIAGWSCCTLHTCAMDLIHYKCNGQYFSSREYDISNVRCLCVWDLQQWQIQHLADRAVLYILARWIWDIVVVSTPALGIVTLPTLALCVWVCVTCSSDKFNSWLIVLYFRPTYLRDGFEIL